MDWKGLLMLAGTVACTATGQVLMKKGVTLAGTLTLGSAISTPQILLRGMCYILGFIIWLNVLQVMDLSIAYPASSFVYVLVILLSAVFLGEPITLLKIVGMACICTGVIFIGFA